MRLVSRDKSVIYGQTGGTMFGVQISLNRLVGVPVPLSRVIHIYDPNPYSASDMELPIHCLS